MLKYILCILLNFNTFLNCFQLDILRQQINKENYQIEDLEFNPNLFENYKHPYIFISLGNCCKIAWFIRDTGLNSYSYPFDWLLTPSCNSICDLLENGFNDFMLKDNLSNLGDYCRTTKEYTMTGNSKVIDNLYDIESRHDFAWNLSIENQYLLIKEKYQRRINRLYRALNQTDKPVYLVRKQISREQASRLSKTIKTKFPKLVFTLIALDNTEEIKINWNIPNVRNFYFDNPTFRYDSKSKKYIYDSAVRFDLWQKVVKSIL